MTILLAILTGAGVGYLLERGDVCFHSTWRSLLKEPPGKELFKLYLLFLLISIPLVQLLIAFGLIEPWIPPFVWQANIFGGLIFGVGMTIAATCITGVFYKFGHGMLGMAVAFVAWSVGDILTYAGPLAGLRNMLRANPITFNGSSPTLLNGNLWLGLLALGLFLGVTAVYLFRADSSQRTKLMGWKQAGLLLALFMTIAWFIAALAGSDYTFGTSGVPTAFFLAPFDGPTTSSTWIIVTLFSIVIGAFIAARRNDTLWVRGESPQRYAQLAGGGFLMGVGAGIAGGCNLGHGMVGVSLLSIGSITTTLAIVGGLVLTDRIIKVMNKEQAPTQLQDAKS